MNTIRKFSLLQYSVLGTGFTFHNYEISAQAFYRNIDPDIVLDNDFESAGLDMDENGIYDFAFLQVSYTWYTTWPISGYVFRQRIWCGPYGTPANAIVGNDPFIIYDVSFPYALSLGDTIHEDLKFYNWGFQPMAYRTVNELGGQNEGGYWYPEIHNHFLGVRFIDVAGDDHYGWIRCSVLDTGRVLVIKDYAYELTPYAPILAGDTIGGIPVDTADTIEDTTLITETILAQGISLYNFNHTIYIHTTQEFGNNLTITVYDLTGKMIRREESELQYTEVAVDAADGMYIVEVTSEKSKYRKKVFFE